MEKPIDCTWKPVPAFDNYEVSDTGLIWSKRANRLLKCAQRPDGYIQVRLYSPEKVIWCAVHRVVAEAFIPKVEGKPYIDHIDGTRNNNRAANLRWCTRIENMNFDICRQRSNATRASETHKKLLRDKGLMFRVKCIDTGVVYASLTCAARGIGVAPSTLSVAIRNKKPAKGVYFEKCI